MHHHLVTSWLSLTMGNYLYYGRASSRYERSGFINIDDWYYILRFNEDSQNNVNDFFYFSSSSSFSVVFSSLI